MRLPRRPHAVIYDLDGVLLDTEPFYTVVTQEIVARYGKTFDWSVKKRMIGRPSRESALYLVGALGLPITADDYLRMREARLRDLFPSAREKPGAEAYTRSLHARQVPQAIATSSERDLYVLKTSRHLEWFSQFAVTVTGDDPRVRAGKPAPDIFLVAAEALRVTPRDCVVFEDSPVGLAAAHAAGMQVVAVPDPGMDNASFASADLLIEDFRALRPEDLGF